MALSGTNAFNLDVDEVIQEAFERCGLHARSGYDLKSARRSLNLLLAEWANRGINLWTVEQGSISLTAGTGQYDLPVDTVDLLEHVIRTNSGSVSNQSDLTISRISVSTYASIPSKLNQGRPIQVYIDRQSGTTSPTGTQAPNINVWPVPDRSNFYTFVYWRMRRIQDASTGAVSFDVPFRFLPCLTAGLAYYLALKVPNGMERLSMLKAMYDETWDLAAGEDREKASDRLVPRQMFIT